MLISYKNWKERRDDIIETVEFKPPEGYNSAQIGYFYKGTCENKTVLSLLVYLASKGYLKIEDIGTKGENTSSEICEFRIIKLKEYDGEDKNEKLFMKDLFANGDSVTAEDLYDKFYITISKIKNNIEKEEKVIYQKSIFKKSKKNIIMIFIIFALITVKPILEFELGFFMTLLIFLIGSGLLWTLINIIGSNDSNSKAVSAYLLIFLVVIIIPWIKYIFLALQQNSMYIITYIIGLISIGILTFIIKNTSNITEFGKMILGKIRGFIRYVDTAEKEKLEAQVNNNPEYFFDILPYVYALGISDKWIKKFEIIALKKPKWYGSNYDFDYNRFNNFINDTYYKTESAIYSSKMKQYNENIRYSDNDYFGGGDSGGGFSDGGSGGGGGGSW